MPDGTEMKGAKKYGHDWCEGNPRPFCTKCSMTLYIQCITLYHKQNFVLLTW